MLRYSKGIINVILLGWVCFLGKTIVADEAYAISNIGEDINRPSTELGDADWGKDDGKWTVGTGIGTGSTGGDFERVVDVDLELGNFNGQTSTQVTGTNTETADISCSDLGYNMTKENSWKCYDKYFICPFDANYIKCDRIARVGDIKYSKASQGYYGWLKADGRVYDPDKYQQLYKLIQNKFGGTTSAPKLPNYSGVFLRGKGTSNSNSTYKSATDFFTLQNQAIASHSHKISYRLPTTPSTQYYSSPNPGYDSYCQATTTTLGAGNTTESGSDYGCPERVGLYVYIYAGEPSVEG